MLEPSRVRNMLAERVIEWTQEWKRQGLDEGRKEGRKQGESLDPASLNRGISRKTRPTALPVYNAAL